MRYRLEHLGILFSHDGKNCTVQNFLVLNCPKLIFTAKLYFDKMKREFKKFVTRIIYK